MTRALVAASFGVSTVTMTACESTEQESAKLGGAGQPLVTAAGALHLGAANHSVRVSDVTLLSGGGRMAVVARLTDTGPHPQINVPLLAQVKGAAGKVLYSNQAGGLEALLQRIPLLRPGRGEWWVDDQVLTSQSSTDVKVRVGTGPAAPRNHTFPDLTASVVRTSQQAGISVLSGELVNHSATAPPDKVGVFAVASRAGRVVAAGRAIVGALPARAGAPVPFQIYLVGSPAGATVELTAVPTGGGGSGG